MFKKTKPRVLSYNVGIVPHCDQRILHAPGECTFCDKHPDWQALRQLWGIAFTGYTPEHDEIACPSELVWKLDTIEKWKGNRATKGEDVCP